MILHEKASSDSAILHEKASSDGILLPEKAGSIGMFVTKLPLLGNMILNFRSISLTITVNDSKNIIIIIRMSIVQTD